MVHDRKRRNKVETRVQETGQEEEKASSEERPGKRGITTKSLRKSRRYHWWRRSKPTH